MLRYQPRSPIQIRLRIGNVHKILRIFDREGAMDYCEEFDEIKTILEYFDSNVRKVSKIYFKGGNEPFVNELETRLQNFLLKRGLITVDGDDILIAEENVPMLRKITVFLFVNVDATYKYNLKDTSDVSHVFEICPIMPKFLLMCILWDLRMEQFLFETLSYMPIWFSFVHYEQAIDTIKYEYDPYRILDKVHCMVKTILINQARSEKRVLDTIDKKIIYGKLYDYLMSLLRQFYTPDATKISHFKKNEKLRYSGYVMKHLLEMNLFCFELIDDLTKADPDDEIEVYEVLSSFNDEVEPTPTKGSDLLQDQQYRCLAALLNALQNHVFSISIEVFLYWAEIEVKENLTLQQLNGTLAYKVVEKVLANTRFAHDVSNQLSHFMIKPKSLEETIRMATMGDKLRALEANIPIEMKRLWLSSVLMDACCFENDECLEVIKSQAHIMEMENIKILVDYIKLKIDHIAFLEDGGTEDDITDLEDVTHAIETDEDCVAQLAEIVVLSLNNLKENELLFALKYQVQLFGPETKVFQSQDFDTKANEFFNKVSSHFDARKFYIICFEYPKRMFKKFFEKACTNERDTMEFTKILHNTREFSLAYCTENLCESCENPDILNEPFYPNFLTNIYTSIYYSKQCNDFLKTFICDNVLNFLETKNFENIYPLLLACSNISSTKMTRGGSIFMDRTAPMLLVAANILEKSRWSLKGYSEIRCRLVTECIYFISQVALKFSQFATKKDRIWLNKTICNFKASTRYYFQTFSPTNEEPIEDFAKYLGVDTAEQPLTFFINNFASSIQQETKQLASNERLRPYLHEVLPMYADFVNRNKNHATLSNYCHCFSNYTEIVKTITMPDIGSDQRRLEKLFVKFLRILPTIPKDVYEDCFLNCESTLSELLDLLATPLSKSIIKNFKETFLPLPDCKAKVIFNFKFQNKAHGTEF